MQRVGVRAIGLRLHGSLIRNEVGRQAGRSVRRYQPLLSRFLSTRPPPPSLRSLRTPIAVGVGVLTFLLIPPLFTLAVSAVFAITAYRIIRGFGRVGGFTSYNPFDMFGATSQARAYNRVKEAFQSFDKGDLGRLGGILSYRESSMNVNMMTSNYFTMDVAVVDEANEQIGVLSAEGHTGSSTDDVVIDNLTFHHRHSSNNRESQGTITIDKDHYQVR
jgi:hypothetical protein